jgi:hypothetical protein
LKLAAESLRDEIADPTVKELLKGISMRNFFRESRWDECTFSQAGQEKYQNNSYPGGRPLETLAI